MSSFEIGLQICVQIASAPDYLNGAIWTWDRIERANDIRKAYLHFVFVFIVVCIVTTRVIIQGEHTIVSWCGVSKSQQLYHAKLDFESQGIETLRSSCGATV